MCGIAGLVGAKVDAAIVTRMTDPIAHRGPDDAGVWIDPEGAIGLGFRRLAILELSPAGAQPMASNDGRWMLTFNGEIYNHLAVRRELEAEGAVAAWRGHSDTETLVEGVAAWGLKATLERCVGMFAVALWDTRTRMLHLARDRFGEKPLYYGWVGGDFVYASELKAIRTHPGFDNPVSRQALRLLAARAYVPAPLSIYERIYKLEPGCTLRVSPDVAAMPANVPPMAETRTRGVEVERYWSYREVVKAGLADPITDEDEAIRTLDTALADAIVGQSVADVPVGAFLSGGIDSSTIVALYRKHAAGTVRTFSIGFDDPKFNEAGYAAAVARHFGTEHNERIVTVEQARDVIPALPEMYDEPFADPSQIPTHLVAAFARSQVTVALSGDAGDELFGGYNRYLGAAKLWQAMQKLPRPLRRALGASGGALPASLWQTAGTVLPGKRQPYFGTKVQKALRTMGAAANLNDVYDSFLDEWAGQPSPVLGSDGSRAGFDMDAGAEAPDAVRMMYCDATSYLPDDILCKVDRACMSVSLEGRVPFLDHRVAELAARIPIEMKIRDGQGKWILRQLLYREAPRELFERPKAGFAMPLGAWLRGPLRDWAEALLDEARLTREGYFDAPRIRQRWKDHLSGRTESDQALWAILMFQAWLEVETAKPRVQAPAAPPAAVVAARGASNAPRPARAL